MSRIKLFKFSSNSRICILRSDPACVPLRDLRVQPGVLQPGAHLPEPALLPEAGLGRQGQAGLGRVGQGAVTTLSQIRNFDLFNIFGT